MTEKATKCVNAPSRANDLVFSCSECRPWTAQSAKHSVYNLEVVSLIPAKRLKSFYMVFYVVVVVVVNIFYFMKRGG